MHQRKPNMRLYIKILYSFLLIFFPFILSGQTRGDSIQRLYIYFSLNGHFSGEYSTDWIKEQSCLRIEIDTLYVPIDKKIYIDNQISKYKKSKESKKSRKVIKSIRESASNKYDNFKPIENYSEFLNMEIIGFSIIGKCCFVETTYSKSDCLSESQRKYLDCQDTNDRIFITDVFAKIGNDSIQLKPSLSFKIKN
jgi:hypothetical protein